MPRTHGGCFDCLCTESNTHMHFINADPERMQIWNTAPNHLPPQFEGQYATAAAGRLQRRPQIEDYGRPSSFFCRLKFEPAVGWHGSIGEHSLPPSNPHILTRAATPHSHATARDPHCGSLGGLASAGPACPHPASATNLFLDLPAGLGRWRLPAAGHRSEQGGA